MEIEYTKDVPNCVRNCQIARLYLESAIRRNLDRMNCYFQGTTQEGGIVTCGQQFQIEYKGKFFKFIGGEYAEVDTLKPAISSACNIILYPKLDPIIEE